MFFVAEIFGLERPVSADARAGARRFVHLAEDERGLAEHAGVRHFVVEVVALARALPDAGEHRKPPCSCAMLRISSCTMTVFPDAGAAEKSDLAALHERTDQVDDLDAGLEHFASWSIVR